MGAIPTTTMRIDPNLKRQANEVFDGLGLTLAGAGDTPRVEAAG